MASPHGLCSEPSQGPSTATPPRTGKGCEPLPESPSLRDPPLRRLSAHLTSGAYGPPRLPATRRRFPPRRPSHRPHARPCPRRMTTHPNPAAACGTGPSTTPSSDPAVPAHALHAPGHAGLLRTDERVRSRIRHPKESQAHGPHEPPTASCASARSISRRSRTRVLRCGFADSQTRPEIPPERSSVGPRRITRVTHSNHQLGSPPRTRRL